ncbi:hypothetical protein [Plantactinospora sp. KBS50]|uniref:hypothetical protein n=1 Tax=Plantactinospora sp. KBS50 TaxID=2024580 RepID=UPI000BAAAB66|nr:hypothetical protein [Plantactinospora sp. KBS50]ASW56648.1 hypothetical protein CIK06_24535 [Plantactinospora sp. KBS50]
MRERWRPIGVLAGVLFAVNVVARLVTRFAFDNGTEASDRISLAMFAVLGVVLAGTAFRWGRHAPLARWSGDLAVAVLVAMALTIFVGPFLNSSQPFADGAGAFFSQIWLYLGCAALGTLIGYLLLTALGRDYRSESLKRYTEIQRAKPRRVVRR